MSLIADLVDRLDADRRYEYEERAGIIEFDGGVPRDEAECLALIDLLLAAVVRDDFGGIAVLRGKGHLI